MEEEKNELIFVFSGINIKPEEYKKTYPELGTIPEFVDISSKLLCFMWWAYNPTSPIFLGGSKNKESAAISEVYGNDITSEYKEKLINKDFTQRERQAIDRMGKFRVDVRYRAKKMSDKIFDDLENLLNIPITDPMFQDEKGKVSTNDYIRIRNDVNKQLEDIVRTKELGFGVTSTKDEKKQKELGDKSITEYLRNKRDNIKSIV